jgi:hypothetical protein
MMMMMSVDEGQPWRVGLGSRLRGHADQGSSLGGTHKREGGCASHDWGTVDWGVP